MQKINRSGTLVLVVKKNFCRERNKLQTYADMRYATGRPTPKSVKRSTHRKRLTENIST